MRSGQTSSLVAGVIVASMGVLPLALLVADGSSDTTLPPNQTENVGRPVVNEIDAVPRDLDEIDPRISDVLYAYGAADAVAPGASDEIPAEIVRVLAYFNQTLVVESQP